MNDLSKELRRKNIHGSSIIPNLNRHDSFEKFLQEMKSDFRQLLTSVSRGI